MFWFVDKNIRTRSLQETNSVFLIGTMVCAKSLQLCPTLRPHGLKSTRLLCPWDYPGKNTTVGGRFLPQGIFQTQGSNRCLLHLLYWQVGSLSLAPPEKALEKMVQYSLNSVWVSFYRDFIEHNYRE